VRVKPWRRDSLKGREAGVRLAAGITIIKGGMYGDGNPT